MLNVLVISDESDRLMALYRQDGVAAEADAGYRAVAGEAEQSGAQRYDACFLDLDSEGWRERLADVKGSMPVIAFSSPDIAKAVEAMKMGACDYLVKPLTSASLAFVIGRHKREILTHKYGFDEIIGVSAPMKEVFGLIKRAAASESNVLITGETGAGKELIARAIHRWSPRSERTFMGVNCGAIPDTLLESELFGFEKGAFTGANYTKKGLLEVASGGTAFFDEIGDVSLMFQTKVLRVLQEGEILRVGGTRQITVDLRFIAATNKDLRAACQRGAFREDLYYRLNVINIHLPPLRDRKDDIPLLAGHFIVKHSSKRKDMVVRGVSPEAMRALMGHQYPGNVRELENIIERAISFTNSPDILPSDLPPSVMEAKSQVEGVPRLKDAIQAVEREVITAALRESGGNISRAATELGIYRQQLQRKLKSLHIAI